MADHKKLQNMNKSNDDKDNDGFPEDSYTVSFIKEQENQYNRYVSPYDIYSKPRRPKIGGIVGSVISLLGVVICLYFTYDGVTSLLKEDDAMSSTFISIIGGIFTILFLMTLRNSIKEIRKKK